MGVNYSHLCQVAKGRGPRSPMLRERAMAVVGEMPGQGVVYRPDSWALATFRLPGRLGRPLPIEAAGR